MIATLNVSVNCPNPKLSPQHKFDDQEANVVGSGFILQYAIFGFEFLQFQAAYGRQNGLSATRSSHLASVVLLYFQ